MRGPPAASRHPEIPACPAPAARQRQSHRRVRAQLDFQAEAIEEPRPHPHPRISFSFEVLQSVEFPGAWREPLMLDICIRKLSKM